VRTITIVISLLIAVVAVAVRWQLFSRGILYGDAAAKTASLGVAGVIVLVGAFSLRIHRGVGTPSTESTLATLTAILGLATTAYAVGELTAPNTPVAVAQPACGNVPVYGARFFAVTDHDVGANARSGPGREFPQVKKYRGDCTLGFDGYCVGAPEKDRFLNTPDQRWLIVHKRHEFVASAVVLSQSQESALGTTPAKECAKLGGSPQPRRVDELTYDIKSGRLTAQAPDAVAVGYGLAAVGSTTTYKVGALGTDGSFSASLTTTTIVQRTRITDGVVLLGAAACLADNVPVVTSLTVQRLTIRHGKVTRADAASSPPDIRARLADISCNSSG
jgi:hypothetical protein